MVRTQIYLTEEENSAILRLSNVLGHGKSELIRQAVDEFIERRDTTNRLKRLRSARGIWAKRSELPDIRAMREKFNRF